MEHRDVVCVLLHRGLDAKMERLGTNDSPLEAAIVNQDEEFVRILLEPHYGITTSDRAFEIAIFGSLDPDQPSVAHLLF